MITKYSQFVHDYVEGQFHISPLIHPSMPPFPPHWVVRVEVNREKSKLENDKHKIRTLYPFNDKKRRGPMIHIHDVDEEEIIHFYAGPFDSDDLRQLQTKLVGIWEAYRGRSRLKRIRLVMLLPKKNKKTPKGKGGRVVIPEWFLKGMPAVLLSGNFKPTSRTIMIEERQRRISYDSYLPSWITPDWPYDFDWTLPVDSDSDWNGIPGKPGGDCRPKLVVNLLGRCRFSQYHEILHQIVEDKARDEAVGELLVGERLPPNWFPSEERKAVIYKNRREAIDYSGFGHPISVIDRAASDIINPTLSKVIFQNTKCHWEEIVVLVPNQLCDDLEHFTAWKELRDILSIEPEVIYRS